MFDLLFLIADISFCLLLRFPFDSNSSLCIPSILYLFWTREREKEKKSTDTNIVHSCFSPPQKQREKKILNSNDTCYIQTHTFPSFINFNRNYFIIIMLTYRISVQQQNKQTKTKPKPFIQITINFIFAVLLVQACTYHINGNEDNEPTRNQLHHMLCTYSSFSCSCCCCRCCCWCCCCSCISIFL